MAPEMHSVETLKTAGPSRQSNIREKNKSDVFDGKELNIYVRFYIYMCNMTKFI
jgi:hypothetical protein